MNNLAYPNKIKSEYLDNIFKVIVVIVLALFFVSLGKKFKILETALQISRNICIENTEEIEATVIDKNEEYYGNCTFLTTYNDQWIPVYMDMYSSIKVGDTVIVTVEHYKKWYSNLTCFLFRHEYEDIVIERIYENPNDFEIKSGS